MTSQTARVSGLLAPARDAAASDAQLLGRFVADRDGPAFAALVARHGPMVLGVCRRIVRDWHAAEDAFQATFLVLARRAGAVSPPAAVAGWLYGVACLVARDARRAEMRRASRERPAGDVPEPVTSPAGTDTDLRAVLDDELRKLPAKYRDLVVACDLEGRPRAPVAAALGIPEGTLSSRLTAARKMLAGRLAKRGVAPPVAAGIALGGVGPSVAACEAPPAVLASTACLGRAADGTVPGAVAALASGAIRTMTCRALAPATVLLVIAACALGATVAATDQPPLPPDLPGPKPPALVLAPPAPKPLPETPSGLLFYRAGYLTLIDPDGKNEHKLGRDQKQFLSGQAKFSPDGRFIAVMVHTNLAAPSRPVFNLTENRRLYVRGVGEQEPGTDLGVECDQFTWSPDGTEIACHDIRAKGEPAIKTFVVNVKTKKKTAIDFGKLKPGASVQICDWSRDGKHFLTFHNDDFITSSQFPPCRLCLMNRDGTGHKVLTGPGDFALFGRLSPDNKRVLYTAFIPPAKGAAFGNQELRVLDTATGKSTPVANAPPANCLSSTCWSPDGTRIAYTWKEFLPGKLEDIRDKETESRLVVCDPDGKNAKTLATEKHPAIEKGAGANAVYLGGVDWR